MISPSVFEAAFVVLAVGTLCSVDPLRSKDRKVHVTVRGEDRIPPADGYQEVVTRLKRAIAVEVTAKDLPAFSIALVEGDRAVWAEGFGFRDPERKVPVTARTVYRVGSVSKLFTDLAVMQLVEEGKLDLDAPVRTYWPEFAAKNPHGGSITLGQLMSHRAGIVRETPVGSYFDATAPTLAATVASLNQTAAVYPPGTKTKYSNAGIAAAGYVLERTQGEPFSRQIDRRLLRPLGTELSSFEATAAIQSELATAWMWTYDGRRFAAPTFALGTAPAGNLYANVLDISKFLVAILNDGRCAGGQLLKGDTLRRMMTPQGTEAARGTSRQFGIGFSVGELDGHKLVGHGGAVYGFATQLAALPDKKLGVVGVASLDGANGVVKRLTDYALRLLLARQAGQPLPEWTTTGPVPKERAAQLIGRYQHAATAKQVEVTAHDSRLFLRDGEFRYELRTLGEGLVVDDVLGYGTRVARAGSDAIEVAGKRYARVPETVPGEAPPKWRGLIGEYGWDHNVLYILEDRGQLWALIEWFYYYPLTELSANEFAFPAEGLYHGEKLVFTRDASGRGTRVVAADVAFPRRDVGGEEGQTFRIRPLKPIDELRREALAATPPDERGDFQTPDLVDLAKLEPTLRFDVRYATTNNFMGAVFYRQPRALMQRPAAEAVARAQKRLAAHGVGLLIHDAYRPWHVTKMFWDATPAEMKMFVANPAQGSRHNRGCAVDLTLCDLRTGEPLTMVSGYDEFSPRAYPHYPGGTSRQRYYRELLRRALEAEGFTVYENEWWHFDFDQWRKYPVLNKSFEELAR